MQFYLVRGATPETVLRAEETLQQRLDLLIEKKVFGGYQAISNWVPSLEAQERRRAAVERTLFVKNGPLKTSGLTARRGRQLGCRHARTFARAAPAADPRAISAISRERTLAPSVDRQDRQQLRQCGGRA